MAIGGPQDASPSPYGAALQAGFLSVEQARRMDLGWYLRRRTNPMPSDRPPFPHFHLLRWWR